ncbi:hypothetical protein Tco_0319311 [Tanacetum coccineum]
MDIRMSRLEKAISEKKLTPATVKAVEEVCVTCGANHNFNNCPLTRGGNDFPVFHDNIHQFQQTAAVGNFVQNNQGNRPPILANQMRPPGFNQTNVQNNQETNDIEREKNFNSNHNQKLPWKHSIKNRQNNQGSVYQPPTNQPPVNQALPYQAPIPQIQGVSKTDFDNYVKANNAILKNVQNQGQNLQNKMANVTSLLTSLCNNFNNSASTLKSGPSTPVASEVSTPKKEPEQNPETSTDKVQKPSLESTAQVPPPEEEESIFMEIPITQKLRKPLNIGNSRANSPKNQRRINLNFHITRAGDEKFVSNPLFEFDDTFNSSNVNPLFEEMKEEVEIENSKVHDEPVLLHKDECFDPGDDMHEVEVFLAMEISTNIEEGYIDSEGDVLFLDNLLYDLIPPSVENDDSENEDNSILSPEEESFNVDHQDDPSIPRPPPE